MDSAGRIMLLSCPGREDVIDFWFYCQRHFWPDCPLHVDILDQPTFQCWTKRLRAYLETIEGWLILWVDDSVLKHFDGPELGRCFNYFISNPDVGAFKLRHGHRGGMDEITPIPELPPYACYNKQMLAGFVKGMSPSPTLWRVEALRDISAPRRRSPEQDDGWVGFYNWELAGSHALRASKWNMVVRTGPPTDLGAVDTCNAVFQGGAWNACAVRLATEIGYELHPGRGFRQYAPGKESSPVQVLKWRAARRTGKR